MNDNPPAVSIIVLGYNGKKYVDGCLTSVLDQDFESPYEVLFVDNGSSDGTPDLADKYPVRVLRLGQNYGYCMGNNKGFEQTSAPLVIFLNQDVVVHRSWLRELVSAVESNDDIKAAHAGLLQSYHEGFRAQDRNGPLVPTFLADLSRLGYIEYREANPDQATVESLFLSGVSIILKRDVLAKIDGYPFDPGMFMYGEDMDLALRIRGAGYRTVGAPRAIVYHDHRLESSISVKALVKTVRIIRNRLLALWKNSSSAEFAALALVTILGSPFNAGEFGLPPLRRLLFSLLLVPPTVLATGAALIAMPRFAERRKALLALRRRKPGWLLRAMLGNRSRLAEDGS